MAIDAKQVGIMKRMVRQKIPCLTTLVIMLAISVAASAADDADLKITNEPIVLDIHFHFNNEIDFIYDNNWPVEVKASELTGVSLNGVTAKGVKQGVDAFNLLMASGELPDIVGGSGLREKFNQYGPKGHFLPLNKLIEQHAPNIDQYFKENPDILNAISAGDGKLYHIPYVPDGKFGRAYFIRTDWLDKLGLNIPDTVEELHAVLSAFKNNDPNGNGLKDEIPYFARTTNEMIRLVTLWDARTSGTDTVNDFYVANGKVRHGYNEENFRTGIRHLARWFAEGLIDNEVYNRQGDIRAQLLGNDLGGMTHDWFASTAGYNNRLSATVPGFEFKPMIPPESISGRRLEEHRRISVKPAGWAISSANEHVVETIKYFDFWFTETGRRLANFGVEGQHYTMVEGQPIFKDEVLNGELPVNATLWAVGAQVPRGFRQDYAYEKQWTNEIALEGIELYEKGDYLLEPFHGVTLNEEEKQTFDFYWNEIITFMLERQEEWVLGLRNVDRDWDSYQIQLDKLGINKVLGVMQKAYDRQYRTGQRAEID